jgi:hypothetical protein
MKRALGGTEDFLEGVERLLRKALARVIARDDRNGR